MKIRMPSLIKKRSTLGWEENLGWRRKYMFRSKTLQMDKKNNTHKHIHIYIHIHTHIYIYSKNEERERNTTGQWNCQLHKAWKPGLAFENRPGKTMDWCHSHGSQYNDSIFIFTNILALHGFLVTKFQWQII